MSGHAREPLVYANARAVAQFSRLAPGGPCIETVVAAAISDGAINYKRASGYGLVFLHDGIVATARRTESPLTGRKAWRVSEVALARPKAAP